MGVRKMFTPEQIIGKLREAEVLLSKGSSVAEDCRKIGVTEVTFYRWSKRQSDRIRCIFWIPNAEKTYTYR